MAVVFFVHFIAILRPIAKVLGTGATSHIIVWTSDHITALAYNQIFDQKDCTKVLEFGTEFRIRAFILWLAAVQFP